MRRFLRLLLLLAALAVATSAGAQDTLKLNQTYRDVIRLNFSSGSTQIPLPPGEWVLVGLEEYLSSLNTPMVRGYLARKESKTLTGLNYFSMNTEMSDGNWSQSTFCERENVLFMEKIRNYSADVDCWAINHSNQTFRRNRQSVRQLFDYVRKQNIQMPITLIGVIYIRADDSKKVILKYKFNPEVEGFSPPKQASWRTNDWHRDRIHTDPEKVAYVDRMKVWAREWKRNVDAGFAGELDKTKIAQPSVSPGFPFDITPAAGGKNTSPTGERGDIEARLTRLKKLHDEGLITDSEYAKKRQEILKGL